jgi:hypothetical protein
MKYTLFLFISLIFFVSSNSNLRAQNHITSSQAAANTSEAAKKAQEAAKKIQEEAKAAAAKAVEKSKKVSDAVKAKVQDSKSQDPTKLSKSSEAQKEAESKKIEDAAKLADVKKLAESKKVEEAAKIANAKKATEDKKAQEAAEAKKVAEAKKTSEANKAFEIAEAKKVLEIKKAQEAATNKKIAEDKKNELFISKTDNLNPVIDPIKSVSFNKNVEDFNKKEIEINKKLSELNTNFNNIADLIKKTKEKPEMKDPAIFNKVRATILAPLDKQQTETWALHNKLYDSLMAEKNAMKDLIIAHNQNIINEKLKLDVSSNLNAENKKLEQANIKVNETKIKYELEQKKLNEAINISNAKKSEFNKTLNEVKSKESDIANASVQTLSVVQNISKMLEEKNTNNNPGKNKNKNLAANKNNNENIKDPSDETSKSFDASTTSSSGGAAGKGYVVASVSAQSGISGNYEVVDNNGNKISLDGSSGFASENKFKFDAKKVNIGSKTSAGVEASYEFDHETKGKDGSVNNIGYKVTIKSGADYDVGVKSDKNSGSVTGSASIGSSVSVDYKQGTYDKDGNGMSTTTGISSPGSVGGGGSAGGSLKDGKLSFSVEADVGAGLFGVKLGTKVVIPTDPIEQAALKTFYESSKGINKMKGDLDKAGKEINNLDKTTKNLADDVEKQSNILNKQISDQIVQSKVVNDVKANLDDINAKTKQFEDLTKKVFTDTESAKKVTSQTIDNISNVALATEKGFVDFSKGADKVINDSVNQAKNEVARDAQIVADKARAVVDDAKKGLEQVGNGFQQAGDKIKDAFNTDNW